MKSVLFSIVVVSLNAESCISATIESILNQTFNDYEVIVKDGGSMDSTLKLIPNSEKIKVYCEKDNSIYQGMNQALSYINGRYIIFMNCGDTFYDDNVLETISKVIATKKSNDKCIIYGNYSMKGKEYLQPSVITKKHFLFEGGLCHQSMFFGKELFESIGNFDETVKICADYELMVRAFKKSIPFEYANCFVCDYEGGGISERPEMLKQVIADGNFVRKKYFTGFERFEYALSRIIKRIKRML